MNEVDEIREQMELLGNEIANVCNKHDTPIEMDFAVLLQLAVSIAIKDGLDVKEFIKACLITYMAVTGHPLDKDLH